MLGDDVIENFAPGKRQYIGQLELLVAIMPYTSIRDELKGRRVIHWIDNKSAIAALVKGYSAAPDSAQLLQIFAAFGLGAGISIWVEWVPSKANIADFPSRGDFDLLTQLGAEQRPFILPTFAAWDEPFAKWADWGEGQTKMQGGCLSRRAWVRSASDMFNTTSAVKSPSGIKTFSSTAPPRSGTLFRSTY